MQNYWVYDLKMKQSITQFINEQIYFKSDNQITHEYNKNIKYYNNFGYNEGIDYLTNKNYNQLNFYPDEKQINYYIHYTKINTCNY